MLTLLALVLLGAGGAQAAPPRDKPDTYPLASLAAKLAGENSENQWLLTLPQAIRMAIDNSEFACVLYAELSPGTVTERDRRNPDPFLEYLPYYEVPLGCFADNPPKKAPIPGPIMIRPVKADTPGWRFRADAMALVRSVEQRYWAVWAQRVRVSYAEDAVRSAQDVLNKEKAELYCRSPKLVEIIDAQPVLEELQKNLKTQTAKLALHDRRLRSVLGLPESDARRIATITQATDEPISCEPRRCASELLRVQADILGRRITSALCDKVDPRTQSSSRMIEPNPSAIQATREQRETQERKEWSEAIEGQLRALEAYCSAVDAGFRQYQQAKQHRTDAARRREAQKVRYETGHITIDRYFEAIRMHAEAVAAEADRTSEYNTTIAALGEAKGTLLPDRFILVLDQPLRIPKNWVTGP